MRLFARRYLTETGIKKLLLRIVMYLLVCGLAFVFLYPFLYMIVKSLMTNSDLISSSVAWLPTELKFENYALALDLMKGKVFAKNSIMVTDFFGVLFKIINALLPLFKFKENH